VASCEHGNEPLRFIRGFGVRGLCGCQFHKKNSAPWIQFIFVLLPKTVKEKILC
jgi:hypothetical protein